MYLYDGGIDLLKVNHDLNIRIFVFMQFRMMYRFMYMRILIVYIIK
jgi:hypothetical protein